MPRGRRCGGFVRRSAGPQMNGWSSNFSPPVRWIAAPHAARKLTAARPTVSGAKSQLVRAPANPSQPAVAASAASPTPRTSIGRCGIRQRGSGGAGSCGIAASKSSLTARIASRGSCSLTLVRRKHIRDSVLDWIAFAAICAGNRAGDYLAGILFFDFQFQFALAHGADEDFHQLLLHTHMLARTAPGETVA